MDGSHSSTNSTPPFLTKTYDMVDDLSTDSVISWAESGNSFIVWNQVLLERELLPMYFKHNNFSSFIRQLNTYGFRKVDPDLWEFANDDFRKGQRQLLKNIHRRKPTFSHSFHPNQGHVNRCGAISESEKQDLEEEIETLKRDKSAYMLDLHRHTQEQHKLESKSHDLVEKLHLTVQRQQQMLALLDSVVHKPDIVSSLLKPCESSKCSSVANKKRRLPTSNDAIENDGTGENQIADPQFVGADTSVSRFSQSLSVEAFYGMESSITFLENIFRRVGLASGESVDILDGSSLAVTEFPASSGSADIILPSELPKLDLPSITSELRQSVSHLGIIGTQHPEVRRPPLDSSRSSMIDMNLMPTTPEPKVSKKSATIGGAPTGANDVFWEQFLTETPGSVETHEVQPEMRGNDDKRYCNRSTEDPNFWSNKKNMDTLTEQMGQLTSVERKCNFDDSCLKKLHNLNQGFRKVDPDLWEFANDDFRKGQRQLLKNIHRRKPTFSHSFHPNQGHVNRCGAISESEKQDLEEEIETLKRDKSAYMLDLHRHTQEQHKLESKSHDLVEKLHLTVQRQQQMLALLDSVVHKPDIVSSLLKPCESSKCSSVANKKRRLPTSNDAIENDGTGENQIADPQFVGADTSVSRFSQSLSVEAFYGMESSITFLENIFRRVGLASGESVDILDGSSLAVTEFPASSGSADIILPSELPKLDLPSITSELRQSVSHLGIIGTQHPEVRRPPLDSSRSSMIDMNLMPTTPEPKVSKKSATIGGAPTGANDVFWEQFLTETPGSVETHEVQPEMRGNDDKRYCNRSTEDPNFWSNKKNMDTLTEQMGQLTSVERK